MLGKKVSVKVSNMWQLVFFAAVSPANNALLLSSVKPSADKSFKMGAAGKQGNLILNSFERLKATPCF